MLNQASKRAIEPRVVVLDDGDPRSRALAVRIGARLATEIPASATHILQHRNGRLEILTPDQRARPFAIDFAKGPMARRTAGARVGEPIARAVGVRRGLRRVVDATAGFGRDAIALAQLGCEMTMIERAPIVAALLDDALSRWLALESPRPDVRLIEGDARHYLTQLRRDDRPEVVYLDPMFPARTKSAAVKRDAQLFGQLVGRDDDQWELFAIARAAATHRVVVKRPRHAAALATGVDATFRGRSVRWDLYLAPT